MKRSYLICVMAAVIVVFVFSACGDPSDLLAAPDNATIYYQGAASSLYQAHVGQLTIQNDIGSNIIYVYGYDNGVRIGSDLLGSYDVIGGGRKNTIRGVPHGAKDIYLNFSDETADAIYTPAGGFHFENTDYTITVELDPGQVTSPSVLPSPGSASVTVIKHGNKKVTITAVPAE